MSTQKQEQPLERPVLEIMTSEVSVVEMWTTVRQAASLMAKSGCGCLVVVRGNLAVGIVTERDIVHKITAEGVDSEKVMIQHIMSTPLITVASNASIREAAEKMSTYEIRKIVVVDKVGKLVGLVTAGDLAHWLAELNQFSDPALNAIARLKMKGADGPYA